MSGAELAGPVLDERSYAVGALGFVNADLDPGVEFAEPANQIRHWVDGQRRQRGDLQPSCLQLDDPGDRVPGFVDRAEHLTGRTDERLSRRGKAQAASHSMKQLHAQL